MLQHLGNGIQTEKYDLLVNNPVVDMMINHEPQDDAYDSV